LAKVQKLPHQAPQCWRNCTSSATAHNAPQQTLASSYCFSSRIRITPLLRASHLQEMPCPDVARVWWFVSLSSVKSMLFGAQ
jgi:hypothetical protein